MATVLHFTHNLVVAFLYSEQLVQHEKEEGIQRIFITKIAILLVEVHWRLHEIIEKRDVAIKHSGSILSKIKCWTVSIDVDGTVLI